MNNYLLFPFSFCVHGHVQLLYIKSWFSNRICESKYFKQPQGHIYSKEWIQNDTANEYVLEGLRMHLCICNLVTMDSLRKGRHVHITWSLFEENICFAKRRAFLKWEWERDLIFVHGKKRRKDLRQNSYIPTSANMIWFKKITIENCMFSGLLGPTHVFISTNIHHAVIIYRNKN